MIKIKQLKSLCFRVKMSDLNATPVIAVEAFFFVAINPQQPVNRLIVLAVGTPIIINWMVIWSQHKIMLDALFFL